MKNKFLLALIITLGLCFAVLVGVIINAALNPQEEPVVSGTYCWDLGMGGKSYYTFNSDGTGKLSYNSDGELIEEEFTYLISGEMGNRNITFTWKKTGKSDTFKYGEGESGGKEAVFINGEPYIKQND